VRERGGGGGGGGWGGGGGLCNASVLPALQFFMKIMQTLANLENGKDGTPGMKVDLRWKGSIFKIRRIKRAH